MKWATAHRLLSLSLASRARNLLGLDPGASAPGFMLPPASQAKPILCGSRLCRIDSL